MHPALSAMAASTDSSVLDADPNKLKFAIAVSFLDFKDLMSFCRLATRSLDYKDDTGTDGLRSEVTQLPLRTFWLSWVLFDMTFQSAEFKADDSDPQKVRDTIRVRCSEESMIKSATNESCMRLFLCTQDSVLAALGMPLNRQTSDATPSNRASNLTFPISSTGWYDLEYSPSLFNNNLTQINAPSVKININVSIEQASEIPALIKSPATSLSSRIPVRSPVFTSSSSSSALIAEASVGSGGEVKETDFREDTYDEENGNNDDVDDYTRHYRVNVEVRSIGGLKRAANAAIHFTYPFLGAGGPVRTHPIWLPANSEGKIDNASASYDCCLSRNRIRDILSEHPLKISALSRTHLGTANIGDVTVDLFGVLESRPHSFRCSVTNKTFKSRAEYVSHRQSLLALRALGQIDRAPPTVPITIWANDSYLPLTLTDRDKQDMRSDDVIMGGKLRVVIIIEELGIVGTEIATPVRPGYKMHNGALYVVKNPNSDDHLVSSGTGGDGSQDPEAVPSPLDQVGISDSERAALEKLKDEWEAYRAISESQWRNSLKERETAMKHKLDCEASSILAERADDLKRAQEEAGRLEVRLRGAIDEAERQKSQLKLKEEQMQMKLAQKVNELQLLQRRVRDEAKARIDSELQKNESLGSQIDIQKQQIERYEKRISEITKEFDTFRNYSRGTPESILREEIARVKAVLGESRAEVERERRMRSEAELEKEHYRAQMHRLAMALKREREKSTASARQDLDQLRLEFLAREERYVLDGDRDELRNIRHELANLRSASHGQADIQQQRQSEQRQLNELKEKQQTHYKQQRSTQLDQSHDGRLSATPYSSSLSPSSSSSSSSSSAPSKPPPSFFHIRVQPTQLLRRDDRDGSIQSDDLEVLSINNDDDSNNDDGYRNHSKSNSNYPQVNSNSSTSISNLIEDEDDEDMPRISLSPPTPMPFLLPSTTFQPQSLPLPLPHTVLGSVRKSSPVSPSQSYPPQSLAQHRVMDTSSSSSSYSGNYSPPKSDEFRRREEEKKGATEFKSGTDPRETLRGLRMQIQELLETGMYSDRDDPVIVALNAEITLVEAMVVSLHR